MDRGIEPVGVAAVTFQTVHPNAIRRQQVVQCAVKALEIDADRFPIQLIRQ